jgi:UDP-N-acetylglucosamine 1-carboxyvinyltransferase
MGAKIEGLGTKKINITGVESLSGLSIQVPSDRIEAGTYAIALAMTGGQLKLNNINATEIDILIRALESTGVETYSSYNSISLERKNSPILSTNIETASYPGFPTDLQAQFMALMTLSNGVSRIKENIFENRFMHVQELARFGANIELEGDLAIVKGVKCLIAAPVMATDLRASASLIIAALAAKGTTSIRRIYHLDRGFEELEKKLNGCGADIKRIRDA